MTSVLIDTDVILDFLFDRQPFSEHAARVLSLCESGEITGFVTPVILSNVYYLLRQISKHEKVISTLTRLTAITRVLMIDREVILQALHSKFTDFEDALQNYAAESYGEIDLILTRNLRDYRNSSLGIMTPEQYLKTRIASH